MIRRALNSRDHMVTLDNKNDENEMEHRKFSCCEVGDEGNEK